MFETLGNLQEYRCLLHVRFEAVILREKNCSEPFTRRLLLFSVGYVGWYRRPLQQGSPAEVSGTPEGSLQPREKLKVTLATRSGVTQIVIFLTH